jgi:putative transposase
MRYRRILIPGATYFFTVNLLNRKSSLLTDHINQLRYAFRKAKFYYPFTIDGIVILPDHLHVVMSLPKEDRNYSLRWNIIKGVFSKQIEPEESIVISRKNKRERGIWQRRFWEHLIRDESDYEHHINYIHYNPVKHGYVTTPTEWEYSSIHRFIQAGVLPKNWGSSDEFNLPNFGEW